MLNENSILQDRMSNIKKRMTIAELLGISGRFKHLKIDKDDDKSKYISELLFSFNLSEQNVDLDMMISELAKFKKQVHINREKNKKQSNEPSSMNSLYHFLEKNLFEISYISNKEKRDERIKKLFDWFKKRQKYEEDIRSITMKTYKEKGEIDEQEALLSKIKNNKEEIIDDGIHRNLELINKKMLNEYERKRLRGPSWAVSRLSSSHSLPRYSFLGKDSKLDTLSMFSTPNDFQTNDFTTLYSSINGTNSFTKKNYDVDITSFIDKPEGGLLEKDYLAPIFSDNNSFLPSIDKETKYSYSFFRPIYNFNDAFIENKIIESKQKNLAFKRAQEEIKEKVKEFGLNRARYKENLNNKYELKNVINMYVNKNKLSSSLLLKYKIKEEKEKEKIDINKKIVENLENNNISYTNNKIINLDINNSASNISSQSKSNPEQKSNEEVKFELPPIKSIIKKDTKNYKDINKTKNINSMKKISFSYSQKMITYNFKDDKEEEKENSDSVRKSKFNPKRSFSFRKKTKFVKKRSRSQSSSMMGLRMLNGLNNNKIITNNIQNLDITTNNVIDIDSTETKKYKISLPKDKINTQIINKNKNAIDKNTDSVIHIISNMPLIKEKMKYNNVCNIKSRNEKDNKNIDDSISTNNELLPHNFSLSAFSKYNILNANQSNQKSLEKKKFHFEKLNQRYYRIHKGRDILVF